MVHFVGDDADHNEHWDKGGVAGADRGRIMKGLPAEGALGLELTLSLDVSFRRKEPEPGRAHPASLKDRMCRGPEESGGRNRGGQRQRGQGSGET